MKLSESYDTLLGQARALYTLYMSANKQRLYWHKKYLEAKAEIERLKQ